MQSNPWSINGRVLLFVMLEISPRSDLGAPLPFLIVNPRFSRCSSTVYSSCKSRARGWSDLCRISLLHALQRLRLLCSAPVPGPEERRPRPMGGNPLLPQSVLQKSPGRSLSSLPVCSHLKRSRASYGRCNRAC